MYSDGRSDKDDYSAFNEVWDKPDDGMHGYLYRFLTSPDATFQHIAVWTIVQLLDSEGELIHIMYNANLNSLIFCALDPQLISNIRNSDRLLPHFPELAASRSVSPSSSLGSKHSRGSRSQSYQETETGDGSGEIQVLARRILEATEAGAMPLLPHTSSNLSVNKDGLQGHETPDAELRRSVRAAFSGHDGRS